MFLNPWYGSQQGGGVASQQQHGGISGLNLQQQEQEPSHLLQTLLERLQSRLRPGWTPHITREGRVYYCK